MKEFFRKWLDEYPDPYPQRRTKRVTVVHIPELATPESVADGVAPGAMVTAQLPGTATWASPPVELWVSGNGAPFPER